MALAYITTRYRIVIKAEFKSKLNLNRISIIKLPGMTNQLYSINFLPQFNCLFI